MSEQKLVFIWLNSIDFKTEHLNKDVFWVPYYLGAELALPVEIVFRNDENSVKIKEYRGVKFTKLDDDFEEECVKYIYENAKKIDVLVLIHYRINNFKLAKLYKKINPNGFVYNKLDIDDQSFISKESKIKRIMKNIFIRRNIEAINCFSVEQKTLFTKIQKEGLFGVNLSNKLLYVPNGLDDEIILASQNKVVKDNIIITVGRLGTFQKNTEMILDVASQIDFKNWKFLLIGPYTDEFHLKYSQLIKNKPHLAEKIILIGSISSREELFEYYKRAKVFVLTSRFESFGIVLLEALAFNNYLLSTDVGGASDLTNGFEIGTKVADENSLKDGLQMIIDNKDFLSNELLNKLEQQKQTFSWQSVLAPIIKEIKKRR